MEISKAIFEMGEDLAIDFVQTRTHRISRTRGICPECKEDHLFFIQPLRDTLITFIFMCPNCDTGFITTEDFERKEEICRCKQNTEQNRLTH